MGLDMYLSRRSYVENWGHQPPENRHTVEVRMGGAIRTDIKPERISYVIEGVAYWRKANAIHKWFVDMVQDGRDECQESYVSTDQLRELVSLCEEVLGFSETVDAKVNAGTSYTPGADGETVVEHLTEDGQAVTNAAMAERVLPTQGGFFFGGTDYDSYYLDDLRDTIRMLSPLLDDVLGSYYYRASW